eukprot:jgi/Mesvir1/29499/Mv08669-RA.1
MSSSLCTPSDVLWGTNMYQSFGTTMRLCPIHGGAYEAKFSLPEQGKEESHRTIISGICYLGVFVFGTNAIGLIAYAIQLATNGPEEPVAKPPAPEKPELPPIKGLYRTTKQDVDAQNSNPDS